MSKFRAMIALLAFTVAVNSVSADIIAYDLAGAPGNQAFTSPNVVDPNVAGGDLVRSSGLTPSGATNSFSASAWDVGDYFSFSFTVDSGFFANLDELQIGTRSSNTGPGSVSLFYSGDGYTTALATISQAPGSNFVNSVIDLSALTNLTGTVEFRLVMTNATAANGGAVSSGGTFRVTNFFNPADTGGFRITGDVLSSIPEPSLFALTGAVAAVGLVIRRRK